MFTLAYIMPYLQHQHLQSSLRIGTLPRPLGLGHTPPLLVSSSSHPCTQHSLTTLVALDVLHLTPKLHQLQYKLVCNLHTEPASYTLKLIVRKRFDFYQAAQKERKHGKAELKQSSGFYVHAVTMNNACVCLVDDYLDIFASGKLSTLFIN